jgi:hypothetical protein
LENFNEIISIELNLPFQPYINIDFSKFKSLVKNIDEQTIFLPTDKPSGHVYGMLERK